MEFIDDLKIIWRFLSKYKKQVYTIFIVAIFASFIEAVIPYIYGKIIDLIIINEAMTVIFLILFLWLVLSLIKDWGWRYSYVLGRKTAIKCAHDFILVLNSHSLNLKLQYHKEQKSGKLASRYIKASDALEGILNDIVFWFVSDLLVILFILIFLALFIHWLLFLIIVINILVYFLITLKYSKPVSIDVVKTQKSYEDAYGLSYDSISNIQTVKANSKEKYENEKISLVFKNKTRKYFKRVLLMFNRMHFFQSTCLTIGIFVLFIVIIPMLKSEIITTGQFVTVVGYLGLLTIPMRKLGGDIDHFRRWMGMFKRGYSLLNEKTEPYDKKGSIKLKEVKGEIEFRKINFCYHKTRKILRDISFKIGPSKVVALVGESGVGKSTMMDMISRYNIPASGKIFLDGIDIQKIDLENLREQIAIVPQEVSLFNDTLRNNIIYGKLDATDEEINQAVKAANADEFINNFPDKINQEVGERGVKLSTGQKQRVAIARAILKDPKILILDEATSALDSKSELLVQQALKRLIKSRTTFVIAHRLSTIMHADKILVIDKSEIVEEGRHEELIKNKKLYYKLFTLQSLWESDE
ncbi:MAG: ABC transporter ATP-binding protein [Candidatus Pacebacteria bacterium]|nr:ABC transporter ATP-binding protein [Candidatus Paceibacterota bacterium]